MSSFEPVGILALRFWAMGYRIVPTPVTVVSKLGRDGQNNKPMKPYVTLGRAVSSLSSESPIALEEYKISINSETLKAFG